MEKVFGRHRAEIRAISGVYRSEAGGMNDDVSKCCKLVEAFDEERRPPPAHPDRQDGPGRPRPRPEGDRLGVRRSGFDVDIGPLFATPDEAARQAVENDVHVIGVSSLTAGHLTLVPDLKAALEKEGRDDIMIVVGGVIPPSDYEELFAAGAKAVFGPGTNIPEAAADLIDKLNAEARLREAAAE